jgi:bacterioferritin-associated ferredoxin
MEKDALLRRVAPCGLDCGRCLDNPDSPIVFHARELRRQLGGFSRRAGFFAKLDPAFAAYGDFEEVLARLGRGSCGGCREGACLFADCRVKDCVREQGVAFCHACKRFETCDPGLPPGLSERWRAGNRRLAEMGLEAYVRWLEAQPRY